MTRLVRFYRAHNLHDHHSSPRVWTSCTVDPIVVYLGDKLFQVDHSYVALSPVRLLEGLQILVNWIVQS